MHVADGRGVVPACNRTFTAILRKLILRKNISCRLIKINLTVRKLWQVHEAILQTQQFQIAYLGENALSLRLRNPQLWWPNGLGDQPLYTASVSLLDGDYLLDRWKRRIGLQDVKGLPGKG